jgi:hypothetical protein
MTYLSRCTDADAEQAGAGGDCGGLDRGDDVEVAAGIGGQAGRLPDRLRALGERVGQALVRDVGRQHRGGAVDDGREEILIDRVRRQQRGGFPDRAVGRVVDADVELARGLRLRFEDDLLDLGIRRDAQS